LGALHARARELLLAARVVPIAKSDGGTRPIAILAVAVRTAIGLQVGPAARLAAPELREDGQFAIRTASACERVACMVQVAHEAGQAVALVDRRNAYGAVYRRSLRNAVEQRLADCLPLFDTIYGAPTPLCGHVVEGTRASNGVLQGDPLAPLAFALFAAEQAKRLRARQPNVKFVQYLDDIAVIAPDAPTLWAAVDALETDDHIHGLTFVPRKCASNVEPPHQRADWSRFGAAPAKCLGVPVGDTPARREAMGALAHRVAEDLALIGADGLGAYALLRFCAGAPRMVHALRALDDPIVAEGCVIVDQAVEAALGRVAGVQEVPPHAALPLRMGGCGTVSTRVLAPAARLAGLIATARGDERWPLERPEPNDDAADWCSCGAVKCAAPCNQCALCCVGDRGEEVCAGCRGALEAAARALPTAQWDWLDEAATTWLATTSVPPPLARGFIALAGARRQPQRALHQATLQLARRRLLEGASRFLRRRLESNASIPARALYTPDGLVACGLDATQFAYGLRLRLAYPGATEVSLVSCTCSSAVAGRRAERRRHFVDAPGDINARAHDWHARACKRGPLARGAHQFVASALSLQFARWGIPARWEAGGIIPEDGGRRCDVLADLPGGAMALDIARCDVETGALRADSGWPLTAARERLKVRSYTGHLTRLRFAPLVVDEVGRLGPESSKAIRAMAAAIDAMIYAEPGATRAALFACVTAAVIAGQHAQLVLLSCILS
ncbi:MAG TPA: reverse transcriptase domain-containing protein, partial [Thauera aminoaromatica]|nr:reverse transcriptase domain-containing protein [Thauera aminoaromatica]